MPINGQLYPLLSFILQVPLHDDRMTRLRGYEPSSLKDSAFFTLFFKYSKLDIESSIVGLMDIKSKD